MPRVTVAVPGLLTRFTDGDQQTTIDAATVRECLDRLVEQHPGLEPHLFDGLGELRNHILVARNGSMVDWAEADSTDLRAGDTVSIIQAVSGG